MENEFTLSHDAECFRSLNRHITTYIDTFGWKEKKLDVCYNVKKKCCDIYRDN